MAQPVTSSKNGFTLIELLIAIVIMAVSMLAIITTQTMALKTNLETDVRNTSVRLMNQTAETLRTLQWAEVAKVFHMDPELEAGIHTRVEGDANQNAKGFPALSQTIRNGRQDYRIQWMVEDITVESKRVTITVAYTLKGQDRSNVAVIFRNRGKAR